MEPFVVFAYTRAQALKDGVLIDVSEMAREAGFKYPAAVTRAVWERYVRVPENLPGQDESGRLWDILWMLLVAIRRSRKGQVELTFPLYVQMRPGEGPKLVTLKSVCGPGDQGEPVLTIMLPHED